MTTATTTSTSTARARKRALRAISPSPLDLDAGPPALDQDEDGEAPARRRGPPRKLEALLEALWGTPIADLRKVAREDGAVEPFGRGNRKTRSPGTYRPVGATCPQTCPHLGAGCYAQHGKVAMSARRASGATGPALRAAAAAMVWAARTGRAARLHVSGDFVERGRVAHRYIEGLIRIGWWLRVRTGVAARKVTAWSYTHLPPERFEEHRRALASVGIMVRYSDAPPSAGPVAIVHPFADREGLRARVGDARVIRCPAQLAETVSCADCRACWTHMERVIVFDPHGPGAEQVRRAALRVIQG